MGEKITDRELMALAARLPNGMLIENNDGRDEFWWVEPDHSFAQRWPTGTLPTLTKRHRAFLKAVINTSE